MEQVKGTGGRVKQVEPKKRVERGTGVRRREVGEGGTHLLLLVVGPIAQPVPKSSCGLAQVQRRLLHHGERRVLQHMKREEGERG